MKEIKTIVFVATSSSANASISRKFKVLWNVYLAGIKGKFVSIIGHATYWIKTRSKAKHIQKFNQSYSIGNNMPFPLQRERLTLAVVTDDPSTSSSF